uniref:Endonuclease/exonuclease/phosphatase domain-containing protein n=1 Tax=Octopus bimaculoides TaxID=37653 RepID=A0A0L8I4X8_OCTBM
MVTSNNLLSEWLCLSNLSHKAQCRWYHGHRRQEFACFNINVAASSETRILREDSIREAGSKYTIFWKGKNPNEPCIHGVGLAIKTQFMDQHRLIPTADNEHLMTVQIPLIRDRFLTLISVYAPTLTSEDDIKALFYNLLDYTTQKVPMHDKLILLEHFNGRVSSDHCLWNGILGHHGIEKCNANGHLLLGLCAECELVILQLPISSPYLTKINLETPTV